MKQNLKKILLEKLVFLFLSRYIDWLNIGKFGAMLPRIWVIDLSKKLIKGYIWISVATNRFDISIVLALVDCDPVLANSGKDLRLVFFGMMIKLNPE